MKVNFLIITVLGIFATSSLFVYDVHASIYFDKDAYTWTDKINIRVTEHGVDSENTLVKIHTSNHELKNYKLAKAGNGLFTGEITLTGFSHDVTGDGESDTDPKTVGSGPNNGFLESGRDDDFTLSIKFADGDEVKKTAKINWNIGTVDFDRLFIDSREYIYIKVHDVDMNLNPESRDKVPIQVFSDSDKAGLVIDAREITDDPGTFVAGFSISTQRDSNGNRLFALPNDTIYVQYDDYTLPKPYGVDDNLEILVELPPFPLAKLDNKKIEWSQANYKTKNGTSSAKVIVTDFQQNKFPNSIDTVKVKIISDSSIEGITIDLYETNKDSGVFERTFAFSDKRSAPNILYGRQGDTMTALYDPVSSFDSKGIFMAATTLLGSTGPPLERAPASSPRILDVFGNSIDSPVVGEQMQITSDIANGQDREQKFAYLVMIQDDTDAAVSLAWIDGILNPESSFSPSASWIPQKAGQYVATMFVWESVDNPTALSPPIQIYFTVSDEKTIQLPPDDEPLCRGTQLCLTETILRIVDGDTIYLSGGYEVRLSLVNTPERHQIGFHDASKFTAEMCPVASTVTVDQDDKQPYDVYNRLLGKVTCQNKILNAELLYSEHAEILIQYCSTSEFSDESWAQEFGC
ncbi:MAG: thermonuclease family protein [Nitrosopumilus sp.]|uniref:thermonuclease family protein n=1 Tax=Nitrosopumilus sp. TaxID=2024843 RepID=UPI00247E70B2|nr:thermonuclease family protein [Nitrosopumilus sp.]MCV0391984.1 thermonuclease family protein [Nitrosopumilus sp.]